MYQEIIYRLLDGDSDVLDGVVNNNMMNNSMGMNMNNNNMNMMGMNLGSMGFSQPIQNELTPLLQDEKAFEVFTDCLTNPSNSVTDDDDGGDTDIEDDADGDGDGDDNAEGGEVTANDNGDIAADTEGDNNAVTIITGGNVNSGNNNNTNIEEANMYIKRSFRAMTLIINDTNSAQQMHKQLGIGSGANSNNNNNQRMQQQQQQLQELDEEKMYEKFLMSPTRAVILSKKIFASYNSIYQSLSSHNGSGGKESKGKNKSSGKKGNVGSECGQLKCNSKRTLENVDTNELTDTSSPSKTSTTTKGPKAHLPHLNKTLSALLAAYPKQVILASCANGKEGIQQSLEPMLQLQKYCADYTSPINTLVDLITMGCTGRKRETVNLQQQAMMAASNDGGTLDQILISIGPRKKFVRSLSQWGIVKEFIDIITDQGSKGNSDNDDDIYEHVAESACDALLSIVEFICFPQQIHPALAMNGMGNDNLKKSDSKIEESAGEEELFSPLASKEIISQLAKCAYCVANPEIEDDVEEKKKNSYADVSSRTLLGVFEVATGKARKSLYNQPMETVGEDDGDVECKAQKEEPKELPGIDDNKFLKAGVTAAMHSTLVMNIESIVQAMDIYVKTPLAKDEGEEEGTSVSPLGAVSHPGRYTIERPFTSRRLELITLFADIVCYEDRNEDKMNRSTVLSGLEELMKLPLVLQKDDYDESAVMNPWPGLCDFLFDYPENSMYGVQFFRMIHALCMTNHEKTLKIVVQKCKFLSKAIKECKKPSGSNRGVLLRCLNALRLHSLSVGPHSFLRHYLDSHDGWKAFEGDLKRYVKGMTLFSVFFFQKVYYETKYFHFVISTIE
jgi:hypothetical protein